MNLGNLFGWSAMKSKVPPKVVHLTDILTNVNEVKQEVSWAIDCSGSTLFADKKSFDSKGFDILYVEALHNLLELLPPHKIVCWSTIARQLDSLETSICLNALKDKIPFCDNILQMNGGTNPENLIPLIRNKTTILVTDGEINESSITKIKSMIPNSGIGYVFLVIIPHIDSYGNLYNNSKIEIDPKDQIRLSIPQAFSERLAAVIVWNYRTGTFEIIPSLTAPWIDSHKNIKDILAQPVPITIPGKFVIKVDNSYKSFVLEELVDYVLSNVNDEASATKLFEYDLKLSIRQQGTIKQKELWNDTVQKLYNKLLSTCVDKEFTDIPLTDDMSMLDRVKITVKNTMEKKKVEAKYSKQFGDLCANLLIDKTVGEITNIGRAKATQTDNNVNQFKSMNTEDKFSQIAPVLPVDECSICGNVTNIYKAINVSDNLLTELSTCAIERQVTRKKGRVGTIRTLDQNAMKAVLTNFPPKMNFLNFCSKCANITLSSMHLPSDPEYGITKIIPHNIENGIVLNRLVLFPLIGPESITEKSDPNDPKLSFSRQWIRGFLSKAIGLDPASTDTLSASIMFLTSLATSDNAKIIFANQTSLLRGGRFDKFKQTVGRLFYPSVDKISAETLALISMVEEVIDLAQIPVLPESNKLLLLCLINRKVSFLIRARDQKNTAMNKLNICLDNVFKNCDKFGITSSDIDFIKTFESVQKFKEDRADLIEQYLIYYLQNTMNIDINSIARHEEDLLKVLNADKIEDIGGPLGIDIDYLLKMINKSNMQPSDFLNMIPNYVKAIVGSNNDSKIICQFL